VSHHPSHCTHPPTPSLHPPHPNASSAASAVTALGFFFFGFGLAYGEGPLVNAFIGSGGFALQGVETSYAWFVQYSYANNAATIMGGALAARTRFTPYVVLALAMSVVVFPVAAHWVWARTGWLNQLSAAGPVDFVGAGPVHLLGGVAGLVSAGWW
jgi:ammonium transporter, Amt family